MKMKNDEFTEQMRGYRQRYDRGEKEIACRAANGPRKS